MSKMPLWLHVVLTFITGGTWLVVLLVALMVKNLKK